MKDNECDVCGAKLPATKAKAPEGELTLCEECGKDLGHSKIAGCC